MKALTIFLLAFLISINSFGMTSSKYFICYQVGFLNNKMTLVTTGVASLKNKEDCTKGFSKKIEKKIKDKFKSDYEPSCYGYDDFGKARESFLKKIKLAKKRNFKIFFIDK